MSDRKGPVYIAFAQQKGGCAKTVSACWVAWLMALKRRVAVVDLDPQGGATALLGRSDSYRHGAYDLIVGGDVPRDSIARSRVANCMLVPATESLIMAEMDARIQSLAFEDARARFTKIFQAFDFVIFDCGAGLGILSSLAMTIAQKTIIPQMPGNLEERATHATFRHLGRLRDDATDAAIILPVMQDIDYVSNDGELPVSSTAIPFDPEGAAEKFMDLAGTSSPDTSDAMIAAYFALVHELESGDVWQEAASSEPRYEPESVPESVRAAEPEYEEEAVDPGSEVRNSDKAPPSTRPDSSRFSGPQAETMTDIFDALHQKRSMQRDQEPDSQPSAREHEKPANSKNTDGKPRSPMPSQASSSAPPTYQSLRDIHQGTLEEAPKTRSMFWLRLGLALIAIGVAIIGIFTDFVGKLAMWTAVGAVVILFVPDIILRFITKDR